MNLDLEQQQILEINQGIHAVQAPAGCGKTEILTQRIGNAVRQEVPEKEIVCLTFTNKAAAEMKKRFLKDGNKFEGYIGNIHNFCLEFLKRNNLISGRATLLGDDEYTDIIEGIIKKNKTGYVIEKNEFIKYIMDLNRTKKGLEPIFKEEFYLLTKKPVRIAYNQLYKTYESVKTKFDFIDFDDLMTMTIHYLKSKEDLIFNRFDWLQIDESQDLNLAQWEIIDLISQNAKCIIYYGDYEQSIYSFLGTEEGRFYSLFNRIGVTSHYLTNNYRSSQEIIDVLNAFLKKTIKSKISFSNSNMKEEAKVGSHFRVLEVNGTLTDELEVVASHIVKLQVEQNNRIGILCRTNKTVDQCSEKLAEIGINCFKLSGNDIFKNKELKLAFASLNGIVNPFDILSWSYLFRTYTTNIDLQDARQILHKAFNAGLLPKDFLDCDIVSQYEKFCFSYENERIVVFDTETTSLDTDNGEIIQIAAVELINGKIGRKFEVYIKTTLPIDQQIVELTKITNEKLMQDGKEPREAIDQFVNFLGENCTILAHNLDFDISILNHFIGKHSEYSIYQYIEKKYDSLVIAKLLYPDLPKFKLAELLECFNLEGNNSHNALDDVLATISLVNRLYADAFKNRNDFTLFVQEHQVVLREFKEKYSKLYNYLISKYYESVSLADLIDFIVNLNSNSKIVEKEIYKAFLKYTRNLEINFNFKSVRMRLQEDFQQLKSLKESDLVSDVAKVVVSTVHKSKGLSFDKVVVVESINKSYPSYRATVEKDLEKKTTMIAEDKRLFYVALSRAKKNIIVTFHTEFISYQGTSFEQIKTPFLDPINDLFEIETY